MRTRAFLLTTAFALVGLSVALAGPATPKRAKRPSGLNAFQQFMRDEGENYRQFREKLDGQKLANDAALAQIKQYGEGMIARLETFKNSAAGTSFTFDASRQVVGIAASLMGDEKRVRTIIDREKDPIAAGRLKLFAADGFANSVQGPRTDLARKLIEEVLAMAKGWNPELYQEAETMRFQIAPEGLPFPEFPLGTKDLDGRTVRIADYKGKVVLVVFWATWSSAYMGEVPRIIEVYRKYNSKGFEVVGISEDRSLEKMLAAMKEREMAWRQVFDGQSELGRAYRVPFIPTSYLVGADGKIVATQMRGGTLEEKLAGILGKVEPSAVEKKPAGNDVVTTKTAKRSSPSVKTN